MRPVVGVTSIPRRARAAFAELPHETVPEQYLEMLDRAGVVPVVIPAHGGHSEEPLARLDGLVLTGGGDVDPGLYESPPGPATAGVDRDRDATEVKLVRLAVERDLPLLALCRGIQVLNVALGGSLVQDISTEVPGALEHWNADRWDRPSHDVRIERGSRLRDLIGGEISVNSIHHQAVDRLGSGLRAVARSPDGVVEGVEAPELRFFLGLQWHAECLGVDHPSARVFEAFAEAAGRRVPGPA